VIIALEFKKSLLVVAERRESVVQIRSVVTIALLAVYRKVIIPDLTETDALHVMAFAAVITVRGLSQPTFATKSANSGPIACPSALANAWRRSGAIMRSRAAKMHDDGLNAKLRRRACYRSTARRSTLARPPSPRFRPPTGPVKSRPCIWRQRDEAGGVAVTFFRPGTAGSPRTSPAM
jgi:Phosphate-starvation-inducible E family